MKTEKVTREILNKYKKRGGRMPSGMAGAAIYLAAIMTKEKKTQNAIAKVAFVTEATIRNRYKAFVKNHPEYLPYCPK